MQEKIDNQIEIFRQRYMQLDLNQKQFIIANLLYCFSQTARACYVNAGNSEHATAVCLTAYNEAIQIISKQNVSLMRPGMQNVGYPDEIFFETVTRYFISSKMSSESYLSPINDAFKLAGVNL